MIIYRYFVRETFGTFVGVVSVLYLIFISNRFIRYLADAASGKLPADVVTGLLAVKSLSALPVLLPLSFFLAVLIALGRFYKDSEMTALAACGIGVGTVLRALGVAAVALAVIVGGVTFVAAPWAQRAGERLQITAEAQADFAGIAAGRFKEVKNAGLVFYVERLADDGSMEGVFAEKEEADQRNLLVARRARQTVDDATGERYLVFYDGVRYEGAPGEADFRMIEFERHGVRMPAPAVSMGESRLGGRSTPELWARRAPDDVAELHWRLAMPVSVLILCGVAIMLSRTDPRQGRFAKLVTAILVYMVYNNLMGVGRTWVERGKVPEWVGLWWVHALMLALFAVLWLRQSGWSWRYRAKRRVQPA